MINKKEFEILYREQLKPQLIELEKMRRKVVYSKLPITIIATLSISAIAIFFGLYSDNRHLISPKYLEFFFDDLIGAFGFLLLFILIPTFITYRKKFKKEFIQLLINFINPNLKYFPERTIDYQEFQESKLFSRQVDEWDGEDYVEGTLSDQISLKFSQITMADYIIRETKKRKIFTLFEGVLFIATFSRQNFQGFIHILPALSPESQKIHELWKEPRPGQTVTLDVPFFTRYFEVYSDIPESVSDILSPALMRELVEFRTEFDQEIYVVFVHSKIYVALPKRSIFEPPFFRSLLDPEIAYHYLGEIQLLLGILEEFGLYHPILKKSEKNDTTLDFRIKFRTQRTKKLFHKLFKLSVPLFSLYGSIIIVLSRPIIASLVILLISFATNYSFFSYIAY